MKFVFTFIDRGCFITRMEDGHVLSQGFYKTVEEFKNSMDFGILRKHPKARVHLFLDVQDQSYTRETVKERGVSLRKFLKAKCATETPRSHGTFYKKIEEGLYQFVEVRLLETHIEWCHFLEELGNPLKDVRLLPMELEGLLSMKVLEDVQDIRPCLVLCYYEPNLGLRQTVFYQGKLHVVRLVEVPEDDLSNTIFDETQQLMAYLEEEGGIPIADMGILSFGEDKAFQGLEARLPIIPHDLNTMGSKLAAGLSLSPLSILAVMLTRAAPILPLKLDVLKHYYSQRRWALFFQWATLACIFMLFWGGLYFYNAGDDWPKKVALKKKAIEELQKKSKAYPPLSAYAGFSEKAKLQQTKLLDRYDELKVIIPMPFPLLKDVTKWLDDHWMLRHFEWRYISPKFKREGNVLDDTNRTYETLDLWVDYLGPNHLQYKARDAQIQKPLRDYKITKRTHRNEFEVIHIEKDRENL